jgi:hypothetical protein
MVNPEYVGVSREDLDQGMVETFERYVAKAETALVENRFGVRYGFTDPDLEIQAIKSDSKAASCLRFNSQWFKETDNCATLASKLAVDLREQGFKVKRKVVMLGGWYDQNYVEAYDPKIGQLVQLDVTPRYQKIGQFHPDGTDARIIEDAGERSTVAILPIALDFIATTKVGNSFTDVNLAGGYYTRSPNYRFVLQATESNDGQSIASAELCYQIKDPVRLAEVTSTLTPETWLQHPKECLEGLVTSGIASVDVLTPGQPSTNLFSLFLGLSQEQEGAHTLEYLEDVKRREGCRNAAVALEQNLDVLANIVFHLGPTLKTDMGGVIHLG